MYVSHLHAMLITHLVDWELQINLNREAMLVSEKNKDVETKWEFIPFKNKMAALLKCIIFSDLLWLTEIENI